MTSKWCYVSILILAGGAGINQDRVIHGRELEWPLFVAVTAVSVTILLSAIFYIYLQRKEAIKQGTTRIMYLD